MKVKIGNTIFSPEDQPIMLILDPMDRLNIQAMRPEANLYTTYPKNISKEELESFMDLGVKPQEKKPEIVN